MVFLASVCQQSPFILSSRVPAPSLIRSSYCNVQYLRRHCSKLPASHVHNRMSRVSVPACHPSILVNIEFISRRGDFRCLMQSTRLSHLMSHFDARSRTPATEYYGSASVSNRYAGSQMAFIANHNPSLSAPPPPATNVTVTFQKRR